MWLIWILIVCVIGSVNCNVCQKGRPNGQCGLGPGGASCQWGYYCRNSVCCQIPCKYGDPHPTRTCGMVVGSNNCPYGTSCIGGPADEYFACCPNRKRAG
ncbi:uncharacterized protein LOC134719113 [Mytilus trossulus]|uniref:uncharacterized protein LOC134719113 n=1 Tax=Mytilus trossulus TaxID=6551 RepID=UPI003006D012